MFYLSVKFDSSDFINQIAHSDVLHGRTRLFLVLMKMRAPKMKTQQIPTATRMSHPRNARELQQKVEDFTLPHIVRLDSTGLQMIFRSPPGVQVLFFLVGAQPNYNTNFSWNPPGVQVKFS
jgi:hypothetical protein